MLISIWKTGNKIFFISLSSNLFIVIISFRCSVSNIVFFHSFSISVIQIFDRNFGDDFMNHWNRYFYLWCVCVYNSIILFLLNLSYYWMDIGCDHIKWKWISPLWFYHHIENKLGERVETLNKSILLNKYATVWSSRIALTNSLLENCSISKILWIIANGQYAIYGYSTQICKSLVFQIKCLTFLAVIIKVFRGKRIELTKNAIRTCTCCIMSKYHLKQDNTTLISDIRVNCMETHSK